MQSFSVDELELVMKSVDTNVNQSDALTKAKSLSQIFLPPSQTETAFVAKLMAQKKYQALISKANMLQGKPVADPFVIASAKSTGGTVVTEEKWKPNASKIPNVCRDLGIDVTNVEGMLTKLGWSF